MYRRNKPTTETDGLMPPFYALRAWPSWRGARNEFVDCLRSPADVRRRTARHRKPAGAFNPGREPPQAGLKGRPGFCDGDAHGGPLVAKLPPVGPVAAPFRRNLRKC